MKTRQTLFILLITFICTQNADAMFTKNIKQLHHAYAPHVRQITNKNPYATKYKINDAYATKYTLHVTEGSSIILQSEKSKAQCMLFRKELNERLLDAVKNDDPFLVKLFINLGANINYSGRYGTTPLLEAVERDNLNMARLLINLKADVNQVNNEEENPLYIAICSHSNKNHATIAKLLLAQGADLNKRASSGLTPYNVAEKCGSEKVCKYILAHEDANKKPAHLTIADPEQLKLDDKRNAALSRAIADGTVKLYISGKIIPHKYNPIIHGQLDSSDSDTSDVSFSATEFKNSIIAHEGAIAQEERALTVLQTFFQSTSFAEVMEKIEQAKKDGRK